MAIQEMTAREIAEVSGGVTTGQVLNIGAGTTAVGAAVLFAVGSPILFAGGSAFAIASAGMWLGGALSDGGLFGGGGSLNITHMLE